MKRKKKKVVKKKNRIPVREILAEIKAMKPPVPKPTEAIDALHKMLDGERKNLGSMQDQINTLENQVFELKLHIKTSQDKIEQYEAAIVKLQE